MEQWVLLGGAGLIGSALACELARQDAASHVLIADHFCSKSTAAVAAFLATQVPDPAQRAKIELAAIDGADPSLIPRLAGHVVNLYSWASVNYDYVAPLPCPYIPELRRLAELIAASAASPAVKSFVHVSSGAVESLAAPVYADLRNRKAYSRFLYALARHSEELLVQEAACSQGLAYSVLRAPNIYGAYLDGWRGIAPAFAEAVKQDRDLVLHNGGQEVRQFLSARDAARGIVFAVTTPKTPARVHIDGPQTMPIWALADTVLARAARTRPYGGAVRIELESVVDAPSPRTAVAAPTAPAPRLSAYGWRSRDRVEDCIDAVLAAD